MRISKLLQLAAQHIERRPNSWHTGGCQTISYILDHATILPMQSRHVMWVEAVGYLHRMAPANASACDYWFGNPTYNKQDTRILALCFAAVLAEKEGR